MNLKLSGLFLILVSSVITSCDKKQSDSAPYNVIKTGNPPIAWVARTDMEGKNLWMTGKAVLDPTDSTKFVVTSDGNELVNTDQGGVDILTKEKYGDVHVELEVMIPMNGNSGVYLMGEYEVQIWDSYSKPVILENQWFGTITATKEPDVHVEKGGGEWQTLAIDFKAPRFGANGGKTANALFEKVVLNGHVIHENVAVGAPTPVCLTGRESAKGPLMFQGFVGPVAYRHINIVPVDAE